MMELDFIVTLTSCSQCQTIDEALAKLNNHQEVHFSLFLNRCFKILAEMYIRYKAPEQSSEHSKKIVVGIIVVFVLILIGTLVPITRKRKILSHPIWVPPMEEKKPVYSTSFAPHFYSQASVIQTPPTYNNHSYEHYLSPTNSVCRYNSSGNKYSESKQFD